MIVFILYHNAVLFYGRYVFNNRIDYVEINAVF